MRKKFLTVAIAFTWLISLLIAQDAFQTVEANWTYPIGPQRTYAPRITINTPNNQETYANKFTVDFSVVMLPNVHVVSYGYILDNEVIKYFAPSILHTEIIRGVYGGGFENPGTANSTRYCTIITISGLKRGIHKIEIQVKTNSADESAYGKSASAEFVVNDYAPSTSVLSPRNTTYNSSDVSLIFSVNQLAFRVMYSLDNQANVTVAGNTTLTRLADGAHCLAVYAEDESGNVGESDAVSFTVDVQPTPTISPSPTPTFAPSASPSPSSSPSPNPSTPPSLSTSVSPTSTPTEEPTATPPTNLPKQQKDFWSTSVPVEYIFIVTAVFAAVIFIIIFLAIRNRKHKS